MIELTSGSKRRLSDTDENERITLRQMILNMSICKLQKDQGRKEPSLLRSVAITNTVRYIENEMDEEMLNFDNDYPSYDHEESISFTSANSFGECFNNGSAKDDIQMVERSLEKEQQSKYGAIGDHRKSTNNSAAPVTDTSILNGFLWDGMTLPSLTTVTSPAFESMDFDANFPDVDITLYDYDNNLSSLQMQIFNDWRVFPSSCAMEYEARKPDSFFEELDQIMQVLVGM